MKEIDHDLDQEIGGFDLTNEDNEDDMEFEEDAAQEFVSGSETNLPKTLYQDCKSNLTSTNLEKQYLSHLDSSQDMDNFCESNLQSPELNDKQIHQELLNERILGGTNLEGVKSLNS